MVRLPIFIGDHYQPNKTGYLSASELTFNLFPFTSLLAEAQTREKSQKKQKSMLFVFKLALCFFGGGVTFRYTA